MRDTRNAASNKPFSDSLRASEKRLVPQCLNKAAFLLCCLSLTALARPLWHFANAGWTRLRAEQLWSECLRNADKPPAFGDPVAWIEIETAGIDSIMLLGESEANLARAPVLHKGTGSLTLLSAHRDKHFRGLKDVRIGDLIRIGRADGSWRRYEVYRLEITSPTEVAESIAAHSDSHLLALLTCYPFQYIGPAPERLIVWAEPCG